MAPMSSATNGAMPLAMTCAHQPDLPPDLIEDLGRILGEALVQQFQRDSKALDTTRPGIAHRGKEAAK